jgi:predicted MFS family arabinose efflux permease
MSPDLVGTAARERSAFAPTSLLVGNFVIGTSVLAPTGMLNELSAGFGVSIREASLLITFGAIVMCVGSPLLAWWTSRIDRRLLLGSSLALVGLGHLASAYASSFAMLLALRLLLLAAAAPFTPQAASSVQALVPVHERASTIAFVFLGWSLASALGIPIIAQVAHALGWQGAYGLLATIDAAACALVFWRMPRGVHSAPVDLSTWGTVARNKTIARLLLLTAVLTSGQFAVFTFLAPLLRTVGGASVTTTALTFALFGIAGVLGNVVATRFVGAWGPYTTSRTAVTCMLLGVTGWTLAQPVLPLMAASVFVWGLGFATSNSMQQARLVAALPPAAGASVALNTSSIYIGQALGSAVGGVLFERQAYAQLGPLAGVFMLVGLAVLLSTRPAPDARAA